MTLVEFVTARLDDDEEIALATISVNIRADMKNDAAQPPRWLPEPGSSAIWDENGTRRVAHTWARESAHIVRHDPARVLREVEAKRKLIQAIYTGMADYAANITESKGDDCGALEYRDELLELLALPYADHPDFRDEWRLPA